MTVQEARKKVQDIEAEIDTNRKQMIGASRSLADNAVQAANSKKNTIPWIPIGIGLVLAVILWIAEHQVWAVLVAIAAIFIGVKVRSSLRDQQIAVEKACERFYNRIASIERM